MHELQLTAPARPGLQACRVLVCDSQPAALTGIRAILGRDPEIAVVGAFDTAMDALAAVDRLAPDVVVMDGTMPGVDGFQVARRLSATHPGLGVLVYSSEPEPEIPFCGASGFLQKDAPAADLISAVRSVAAGAAYVDPMLAERLLAMGLLASIPALEQRHWQVLSMLRERTSIGAIAARLATTPETVRSLIGDATARLEGRAETRAIARAAEVGLLLAED